jgi:hypothetical protein
MYTMINDMYLQDRKKHSLGLCNSLVYIALHTLCHCIHCVTAYIVVQN